MQAVMQSQTYRAAGYAALLTVAIFWILHLLIQGGPGGFEKSAPLATIDFVRLRKDTELETRQRKKPPKPEPPSKTPPPPRMKVDTPPPDSPPMPFAMPKMNLPSNISGGPFIGNYVGGDLSGYSDLIPLVRIQPQYPRAAARDRIEGFVVVEITVNPDGTVRSAVPKQAQPRGVFETAAIQSILKWKFKPKIQDGKPVEHKGIQRLDFVLDKDQ